MTLGARPFPKDRLPWVAGGPRLKARGRGETLRLLA